MKVKRLRPVYLTLCVILVLCFIFNTSVRAQNDTDEKGDYLSFVTAILPKYINAVDISDIDLKISNQYEIKGNSDNNLKMYLVTANSHYVGRLLVTKTEYGELVSSFYEERSAILDDLIQNQLPLAFFLYNEQLAVQSLSYSYLINKNGENSELFINCERYPQIVPSFSDIKVTKSRNSKDIGLQEYLSVSIVANANINGNGICWAACCAMISNYRTGTNYTATQLYNYLDNAYSGTPEGHAPWYQRAFNYCGLTYTSVSGGKSGVFLYNLLHAGKPVLFSVATSILATDWHDIVLRGIELDDDGSGLYSFADPNKTSAYLYIVVNSTNGSSFTIPTNSGTYTYWRNTRY